MKGVDDDAETWQRIVTDFGPPYMETCIVEGHLPNRKVDMSIDVLRDLLTQCGFTQTGQRPGGDT